MGLGCSRLACRPSPASLTKDLSVGAQISHARLPRRHPHTAGGPQPDPRVNSCLPSPACPAQRLLAHRCPQDSACSWCWQQGRDGAEAGPSWDKAPFTALASHVPSSASASCHQLSLLPRLTVGGGGQDQGFNPSSC